MDQDQVVAAVRTSTEDVFSTMPGLEATIGKSRTEFNAPGPMNGIIAVRTEVYRWPPGTN